ncbi:MAG: DJ-1/PfpI family protein [Anaerosacchariphilus sp.]
MSCEKEGLHVNYLSLAGNMVNSMQGVKVWTEPLNPEAAEGDSDCAGRTWRKENLQQDYELQKMIKIAVERSEICLMIAEGAYLVAQTGLLFRRKIAACKAGENWKRMFLAGVYEVPDASWVADGKYYSAATTADGLSMALAMLADQIDLDAALQTAKRLGYHWNPEDEAVYQ